MSKLRKMAKDKKQLRQVIGIIIFGCGIGIIFGQAIEGVILINPFDALAFGIFGTLLMVLGSCIGESFWEEISSR